MQLDCTQVAILCGKIYGRQYVKSQMTDILPTSKLALEYAEYMGAKFGAINL
jgi:hypothetical protein